ncbi:hypothetical protein [uncultured Clostridium sp.]|jgi:hypothetical protein|uniref:hypothetical protein n=1 Tax=uncultured Clostridium sp. TaxID=59620 RepID=UPI002616053E|nr:hypothetical protein [uncultured Clostridium sp.]
MDRLECLNEKMKKSISTNIVKKKKKFIKLFDGDKNYFTFLLDNMTWLENEREALEIMDTEFVSSKLLKITYLAYGEFEVVEMSSGSGGWTKFFNNNIYSDFKGALSVYDIDSNRYRLEFTAYTDQYKKQELLGEGDVHYLIDKLVEFRCIVPYRDLLLGK